ncbi:MAG TPA: class I SAM-dependent methyltransferase, partial [Anaeromyxobacteraceae bacterium]|nr:class I SAM-dependent methyltransferase [Anaeromyxobacteraceae bacterium]
GIVGLRRMWRRLRRYDGAQIEQRFARQAPSAQATVDIFGEGAWAGRLPLPGVRSGANDNFDSHLVRWLLQEAGGVAGKRILELGPLEGGHSYMLQQAGASEVVAVESNSRAYLKCLVAKELLGSERCRFLFGDAREYLRTAGERFDAALACGILYHLVAPYDLFPLLRARCTGPVLLWTHYWDDSIQGRFPALHANFSSRRTAVLPSGARVECHRHEYRHTPAIARFWGGTAPYSEWMTREGLLAALEDGGYRVQATREVESDAGPGVALVLRPAG